MTGRPLKPDSQTARVLADWRGALAKPEPVTMADRARAVGVPVESYQALVRASGLPTRHPAATGLLPEIRAGLERWRAVLDGRLPPESLRAAAGHTGAGYTSLRAAAAREGMPLTLGRRVKAKHRHGA